MPLHQVRNLRCWCLLPKRSQDSIKLSVSARKCGSEYSYGGTNRSELETVNQPSTAGPDNYNPYAASIAQVEFQRAQVNPGLPAAVTPSSGSGSAQVFAFTYTDPNGSQDISGSQIVINSTTSGAGACYILFARGSNQIALGDDAGNPGSLTTLGAPTVLQNSQCSVLASNSSQTFSGNTITLNLFVSF